MAFLFSASPQSVPVYKVGVVVRVSDADGAVRYLIVKPKGKGDGDTPYVLPRGTRMYRDPESGDMVDARDDATAARYRDFMEEPLVTAARELEEEAGVPHDVFNARGPVELGEILYHSPSGKGSYPIMWFAVTLHAEDVKTIGTAIDSSEVLWMTLEQYNAHAKTGSARKGYVDIIKRAEARISY